MFLLSKRILEMSFGHATTFLAPRGVYMRLSVCLFVCGMYVEFDLVATARLCRVSHKMEGSKRLMYISKDDAETVAHWGHL